jgi:membrane protein
MASYNAIYSSFAALPIFLVWIYVSWVTVLLGGEVAHAQQVVGLHRKLVLFHPTTHRQLESLALRAMVEIAARFRLREGPWKVADLADSLGVAPISLQETLESLHASRLVALGREGREQTVLLGRDAERIHISDIVAALRDGQEEPDDVEEVSLGALDRLDQAAAQSDANCTLAALLDSNRVSEGQATPR